MGIEFFADSPRFEGSPRSNDALAIALGEQVSSTAVYFETCLYYWLSFTLLWIEPSSVHNGDGGRIRTRGRSKQHIVGPDGTWE